MLMELRYKLGGLGMILNVVFHLYTLHLTLCVKQPIVISLAISC